VKKLLFLSIAAVSAYASGITPSGACPSATVKFYQDNFSAAAGKWCAEPPFSLQLFTWLNFGTVAVAAQDANLSPTSVPGAFGLDLDSTKFFVSGNDEISIEFAYTIDPTKPPILDGYSTRLSSNSPTNGGSAIITTHLCVGDLFIHSCDGGTITTLVVQDFGHGDPRNQLTDSVQFGTGVATVDVQSFIVLAANGGTSQIDGSDSGAIAAVPEPRSGLLLLSGLAAALVFRVRRSRLS